MDILQWTGKSRNQIVQMDNPRFAARREVVNAFYQMQQVASRDGIKIFPFSSYRDYKTQVKIWNKKFRGEKPLYDANGTEINYAKLSQEQIIWAILRWSALPGASRHHWGTEIDVIDKNTIDANYKVKLLPEEVQTKGVFYRLHNWLNDNVHKFDFFQPYKKYQGGMYAEPWHLSYAPISLEIQKEFSYNIVYETIATSDILGKDLVLKMLPDIYENYITKVCVP